MKPTSKHSTPTTNSSRSLSTKSHLTTSCPPPTSKSHPPTLFQHYGLLAGLVTESSPEEKVSGAGLSKPLFCHLTPSPTTSYHSALPSGAVNMCITERSEGMLEQLEALRSW